MHKKVKQITTSKSLELVHMDLIGPTQIESIRGKKYIFVAVDDFFRFTWVNFIREKSDTIFVFRVLCLKIQVEMEQKLDAFAEYAQIMIKNLKILSLLTFVMGMA